MNRISDSSRFDHNLIGKTIAGVYFDDETLVIRFTDNTYVYGMGCRSSREDHEGFINFTDQVRKEDDLFLRLAGIINHDEYSRREKDRLEEEIAIHKRKVDRLNSKILVLEAQVEEFLKNGSSHFGERT